MSTKLSPALFFGIILGVLLMAFSTIAYAERTFLVPTQTPYTYTNYTFFTATTTTATSTNTTGGGGYFSIAGARSVVMYFSRGDTTGQGNSGSTNFKVEVSPDGSTWFLYNTLSQNLATSTDQTTLSSITVPAGTSTVATYLQNLGFFAIRCIAVETTDGEHTCKASATY